MKGFITKTLGTVCLVGGLMAGAGCFPAYRNVVDTCYPERYQHMARKEVDAALAPQVQNGHVLDQTVWNTHFETGSAKLTLGGLDHLQYLIRRRPCPDVNVYVQTAMDISYDPASPEKYTEEREKLNTERVEAVQKFLTAEAAGRNLAWCVTVHNPAVADYPGVPTNNIIRAWYLGGPGGIIPSLAPGVTGGGAGGLGTTGAY